MSRDTNSNEISLEALYKRIQPSAWSRNRQLAGLPTFQVFPWLLAYYGTSDYAASSLSNGKFTSLAPTRSIAESVFLTHLIQQIREQRIDLDATAEALRRTAGNVPPAKTTEAKAFMQPLMDILLAALREHAPAPAEGSAIRQLHTREAELQRQRKAPSPWSAAIPPTATSSPHAPPSPNQLLPQPRGPRSPH